MDAVRWRRMGGARETLLYIFKKKIIKIEFIGQRSYLPENAYVTKEFETLKKVDNSLFSFTNLS